MKPVVGLLALGLLAANVVGFTGTELATYERLPGNKAMAQAIGGNLPPSTSANKANELEAATAALAKCQQQVGASQSCELVRLNDENITTGANLRAQLGDEPHPLFLWRYTSKTATLFLAGSVHVLKPSTYPLPTQLEEAFKQSNNLVLEVNLAELDKTQLQQAVQQRALLGDQSSLQQQLGPDLTERLAAQLRRYGIDVESLTRLKPAAVTQQLVMLRLLTIGYPNNSGVEQHFLAKLDGRSVQGLETIEEQLDLLLNQPMPVQVALLQETLDQFDEVDSQMSDMVLAWLAGDDQSMLAEFQAQAGASAAAKQFYEQLLDNRNVGMARKIRKLLESPGTHMVLVGAAHCPGEKGIVNLLAEQGLHGQRIWSNKKATQ